MPVRSGLLTDMDFFRRPEKVNKRKKERKKGEITNFNDIICGNKTASMVWTIKKNESLLKN